jgi:hypothetical protein
MAKVLPENTGLKSASVVQVIRTTETRGDGESTIFRIVTKFWDFDGNILAENDPCPDARIT